MLYTIIERKFNENRFDYYYFEEDFEINGASICGNSRLMPLNEDFIQDVLDVFDDMDSEYSYLLSNGNDDKSAYENIYQNMSFSKWDYLRNYDKKDIDTLIKLSIEYCANSYHDTQHLSGDDCNYIISALTILTRNEYDYQSIIGYAQGNFNYIIYPVDLYSQKEIKRIECAYFGGGREFEVVDESGESLYVLCSNYWDEQCKEEIKEQLGITEEDELIMNVIVNEYTETRYEYQTI